MGITAQLLRMRICVQKFIQISCNLIQKHISFPFFKTINMIMLQIQSNKRGYSQLSIPSNSNNVLGIQTLISSHLINSYCTYKIYLCKYKYIYFMQERNSYYKKYQFLEQLASQYYYQLFEVLDTEQNTHKIQKVINITKLNQQSVIKQMEILKSLRHPNLARVCDYYIDTQTNIKTREPIKKLHIILEKFQRKFKNPFLSIQQFTIITEFYLQLKDCLEYLDGKNILHRNINIDRLFLGENNRVKITEFATTKDSLLKTLVQSQISEGSYNFYKSPQQIIEKKIYKKSSYWQLAILLIEMAIHKHIYDVYSKYPALKIAQFIEFVKGLKLNKNILKLILPLLEQDYKSREFHVQINYAQSHKHLNLCSVNANDLRLQQIIKQNNYEKIIILNCSNCRLTDQSGKIVRQLLFMEQLDVSGNDLFDKFIQYIQQRLPNLVSCNLAFTNISDTALILLTNVQTETYLIRQFKLVSLDISYTRVTSKGIMRLSKLRHLVSLSIWSGQHYPYRYKTHVVQNISQNYPKYNYHKITVTQQCIRELGKLKLSSISINSDAINGIFNIIHQQPICIEVEGQLDKNSLKWINSSQMIESLYMKDIEFFQLSLLKSNRLKNLSLINCKLKCKKQTQCLNSCQSLTISYDQIKDNDIPWLLAEAKSMKSLNLSNNNIGDFGAIEISISLHLLSQLDLSCNHITKKGARQISRNLPNLKILNLSTNNIQNEGTVSIARNLYKLTVLNLMSNNVTQEGAIQIALHLINMKSLNLSYNNIGNEGVLLISHELYGLSSLQAWQNNIDPIVKDQVRSILKNTKIWF